MATTPDKPKDTKKKTKSAPAEEMFHVNKAQVEGFIVRLWAHDGDVFARAACYDRYGELLNDDEQELAADGPANLPRRKAHYFTLLLPGGQTADGQPVTLQPGDRIMVTGHLRDHSYSESLARIFEKAKLTNRIQPGDEKVMIGRSAMHVVVETLIRLGK